MKNWAFAIDKKVALTYCKEHKTYKISDFIVKYVLSLQYGRNRFIVPNGIFLYGNIFKHSEIKNGAYISTSSIKTIQVIERDKRGTLYCATTNGDHSYYFRSEDINKTFDEILNDSARHFNLFISGPMDLDLDSMPLAIILSEED